MLVAATASTFIVASPGTAQRDGGTSGGDLAHEQAAYDVGFYDLSLRIEPADSSIRGSLTAHVRVAEPLRWLVLDLDTLLAVDSVTHAPPGSGRFEFAREGGVIRIDLGETAMPGARVAARIWYGGRPLAAPHVQSSWSDGFVWARTASGAPWIGVVSVLHGADLWWPVKDHPSEEPDSMALHITVPDPLVVAANGKLRGTDRNDDGSSTFHWFVSTPINNYGVTLNIAPYRILETTYESITGERFPFLFYVLPERYEDGARLFPEMQRHLRFFEELLGPYPFRNDKYGVAHTPYLGMEHQSIIAYGSTFGPNDFGFDWLHLHELSHEWWANMVTARDWKDWWLHEGFGTYMEALYVESLDGIDAYHAYMPDRPLPFRNEAPVAPRTSQHTRQIYPGDMYGKGAFVLHTLRWLIGRDDLIASLRRFAYPDSTVATAGGGCACRLVDTADFRRTVEAVTGLDLQWFFDVYIHRAELPRLDVRRDGERLLLRWETGGLPFEMPLEVKVDGEVRRVAMRAGVATLAVPENAEIVIDPLGWVLMEAVGAER